MRLLASYVYKMLVITYIESHGNEHLREYLCENFIRLIRNFPDLPIGVLIGPLVRQLSLRGVSSIHMRQSTLERAQLTIKLRKVPRTRALETCSLFHFTPKTLVKGWDAADGLLRKDRPE